MIDKAGRQISRLVRRVSRPLHAWRTAGLCAGIIGATLLVAASPAYPDPDEELLRTEGRETGLPIPRFVSIKNEPARMRIGPSRKFAIKWIYRRPGVPLEIIAEYENWRQVRDFDGDTGWMHSALLSGRRTGIVAPWLEESASLREAPSSSATATALLQPRLALRIYSCDGSWCYVATSRQDVRGHLAQRKIWGVYQGELIGN
jgi:SH3-like domain-containing protein